MNHPRLQAANAALFGFAVAHALLTWPPRATVALFAGGAGVAFALEAVGIAAGLLRHAFRPRIGPVPVSILLAWPAVVYLAYRPALLVAPTPTVAAALAAGFATAADAALDPRAVARGAWSYPDAAVSRVRFRGVPWWNFAAWLAVVFATARLPAVAAGW